MSNGPGKSGNGPPLWRVVKYEIRVIKLIDSQSNANYVATGYTRTAIAKLNKNKK